MLPDRITAEKELETAGKMNPGPWIMHSRNAALAAERIAAACGMDSEKAYILGLLHDIGRREGINAVRHIPDGYRYAMSKGWDEVAKICLTHSFPIKNINALIGQMDMPPHDIAFIADYLQKTEYGGYDRLIILCDCLALPQGFCILEKRFIDTAIRYGVYDFLPERWKKYYEYKAYFEQKSGKNLYSLLPGIENCIYL
ncbi:MAG: HD domain-containing protein [Elusimicrobiales bacterium]|nr:HD domain-containing protein [Elusimicrobiales bacterium]